MQRRLAGRPVGGRDAGEGGGAAAQGRDGGRRVRVGPAVAAAAAAAGVFRNDGDRHRRGDGLALCRVRHCWMGSQIKDRGRIQKAKKPLEKLPEKPSENQLEISYTVESGYKVTGYKVNPDLR